jgi:tetratricopeptide (TPR) repeat protein
LSDKGEYEYAIEMLEAALAIDPSYNEATVKLYRWVLWQLERYEDTVALLRRALEVHPNDIYVLNYLRASALKGKDWSNCHFAATRLVELEETGYNRWYRAWCGLPLGYFAEGITDAERGLEILGDADYKRSKEIKEQLDHMASRNAELLRTYPESAREYPANE